MAEHDIEREKLRRDCRKLAVEGGVLLTICAGATAAPVAQTLQMHSNAAAVTWGVGAGIMAVQLNFEEIGPPSTMVTVKLRPEDVLVDEEAAKTREMKLAQPGSPKPPLFTVPGKQVAATFDSAGNRRAVDEGVHEHDTIPDNYGGSE